MTWGEGLFYPSHSDVTDTQHGLMNQIADHAVACPGFQPPQLVGRR